MSKKWVSTRVVAEETGVSEPTVRKMAREGRIPAESVKPWRFDVDKVKIALNEEAQKLIQKP